MRRRTKARECALKILYAIDITKNKAEDCIDIFWKNHDTVNAEIRNFADYLTRGVYKNKELVDKVITKYATNWQIKRMAAIDRNIIRIATFELLFVEEIPPKVSINEAIEIAKKYGDKDSSKFVNGVLDKINKQESKS
ncbi:MAG: transcription antitermination factor NusB [Candidatus Omnitrophica bacterium]|nr:transcription antitermination factor NusB [Candidatus Omnitrophota bacterium]